MQSADSQGVVPNVSAAEQCRRDVASKRLYAFRVLVAIILLTAAVLKSIQLWRLDAPEVATHFWIVLLLISWEGLLSFWLLSNLRPFAAWLAAVLTFHSFAWYSLASLLLTRRSCNCFGDIRTSPSVALSVDILALVLLIFSRRTSEDLHRPSSSFLQPMSVVFSSRGKRTVFNQWFALTMLVSCLAGVAGGVTSSGTAASLAGIGSTNESEAFEPERWVGMRCPLLSDIDIGGEISVGDWTVIFGRQDCERCQKAVAQLVANYSEQVFNAVPSRLAIISLKPDEIFRDFESKRDVFCGRFIGISQWNIETPLGLHLINGVITEVAQF